MQYFNILIEIFLIILVMSFYLLLMSILNYSIYLLLLEYFLKSLVNVSFFDILEHIYMNFISIHNM